MEPASGKPFSISAGRFISSLVATVFFSSLMLAMVALLMEGPGMAMWGFISAMVIGFVPAGIGMIYFHVIRHRTTHKSADPKLLVQITSVFTFLFVLLIVYAAVNVVDKGLTHLFSGTVQYLYENLELLFYVALYAIMIPITDSWVAKSGWRLRLIKFPKLPLW